MDRVSVRGIKEGFNTMFRFDKSFRLGMHHFDGGEFNDEEDKAPLKDKNNIFMNNRDSNTTRGYDPVRDAAETDRAQKNFLALQAETNKLIDSAIKDFDQ